MARPAAKVTAGKECWEEVVHLDTVAESGACDDGARASRPPDRAEFLRTLHTVGAERLVVPFRRAGRPRSNPPLSIAPPEAGQQQEVPHAKDAKVFLTGSKRATGSQKNPSAPIPLPLKKCGSGMGAEERGQNLGVLRGLGVRPRERRPNRPTLHPAGRRGHVGYFVVSSFCQRSSVMFSFWKNSRFWMACAGVLPLTGNSKQNSVPPPSALRTSIFPP